LIRLHLPKLKNKNAVFDEATFTEFATHFMIAATSVAAWVNERDGKLAAFIFVGVYKHFLSGETVGSKILWDAYPQFAGAGVALLYKAEAWWKEQGAKRFLLTCFDERTERLLAHAGYRETEKHFEKVI
jgi:hypothetical protein